MRCAGGNKYSSSMEELNMSGDLTDLLTSMVDPEPENRPSIDDLSEVIMLIVWHHYNSLEFLIISKP